MRQNQRKAHLPGSIPLAEASQELIELRENLLKPGV